MVNLVLTFPGRFAWFLGVSIVFSACGGMYVGIVRECTGILANQSVPEWAPMYFGITKVRHAFFALLFASAVLTAIKCIMQYIQRYLQAWLTQRVVLDMQGKLANHMLDLDLGFFQKERAGELISRVTNDLNSLRVSVKLSCILIATPITLLWFLGVVFYLKWELAVLGLIAAPVGAFMINSLSRKMRRAAKMAQEKKADLTSSMVQFLAGMRTVKAFTCEEFEGETFRRDNRKLFDVTMRRERARARVRPSVELISFVGSLLVLAVGGEWVFNGSLAFKDLIAFLTALGMMYSPAKELSKANNDLQVSMPGVDRVFELLDRKRVMNEGQQTLSSFDNAIRLEDVHFQYSEDAPVLRGVDLEIAKGECVALVGPTGAGKSTLADLVLRFHDPDAGVVTIDGTDIREFTFNSLRGMIALVPQEPFLFNCSIRENIAYGREGDLNAIAESARAAAVSDEIEAMPEGYETIVGERGGSLSGGQRQRVAIARAIFKNAPILILDEATSSLDSESERKVQEALDHLMEGRTSLVIAHRLSTVRHADKIAVLEGGKISAIGRHEELMLTCPLYSNFVRLQSEPQAHE